MYISSTAASSYHFGRAAAFAIGRAATMLRVCNHCTKYFLEIPLGDPEYCPWDAFLQNPAKVMHAFHEDVKKKQTNMSQDLGYVACTICMDRMINSAFIPCGHQAACVGCARRLNNTCPICREPIADVIQTFLAGASSSVTESHNDQPFAPRPAAWHKGNV